MVGGLFPITILVLKPRVPDGYLIRFPLGGLTGADAFELVLYYEPCLLSLVFCPVLEPLGGI